MDGLPGLRRAAFGGAIVHDGDARLEGVHDDGRAGLAQPVVCAHVYVHRAHAVVGANEVMLFIPGQVAQIDHLKFTIADEDSHRLRVFGGIFLF